MNQVQTSSTKRLFFFFDYFDDASHFKSFQVARSQWVTLDQMTKSLSLRVPKLRIIISDNPSNHKRIPRNTWTFDETKKNKNHKPKIHIKTVFSLSLSFYLRMNRWNKMSSRKVKRLRKDERNSWKRFSFSIFFGFFLFCLKKN